MAVTLTIESPKDGKERVIWVYRRESRKNDQFPSKGVPFRGDEKIRLKGPSSHSNYPIHYGVFVLRVDDGKIMREDGHAVIAIQHTENPSPDPVYINVPENVTHRRVIDAFCDPEMGGKTQHSINLLAAEAMKGHKTRIPGRCLENPPDGQPWTKSHIQETDVTFVITYDDMDKTGADSDVAGIPSVIAWDVHEAYSTISTNLCDRAAKRNAETRYFISNPELKDLYPGKWYDTLFCGFARTSEMQVSWHSMPTPGTFGVSEAMTAEMRSTTWAKCVDIAELMTGFDEDVFLVKYNHIKSIVYTEEESTTQISPATIRHLFRIHSRLYRHDGGKAGEATHERVVTENDRTILAQLLNSLEALACISVSVTSFIAQWKEEKFDNITKVATKFGTEQDCEDQAANTVAVIFAIQTRSYHEYGKTPLSRAIAQFLLETTQNAFVLAGFVETHVSVPPHAEKKYPLSRSQGGPTLEPHHRQVRKATMGGHAWCCIMYTDWYRPQREQRNFFIESTCPYLPHPVPPGTNHLDQSGAMEILYGKILARKRIGPIHNEATYKTLELQPSTRYKIVAYMYNVQCSLYVGPDNEQNNSRNKTQFVVGVTVEDFVKNKRVYLNAGKLDGGLDAELYDAMFGDFVFYPESEPVLGTNLHKLLSAPWKKNDAPFLARNGGYVFSNIVVVTRKLIDAGVPHGVPRKGVVIFSAFDWNNPKRTEKIMAGIKQALITEKGKGQLVHKIVAMPFCDLVLVGLR